MGCGESAGKSSEEGAIIQAEIGLCFNIIPSKDIDVVIRKNTYNGVINLTRLQRISSILRIPINDYGSQAATSRRPLSFIVVITSGSKQSIPTIQSIYWLFYQIVFRVFLIQVIRFPI